MRENDPKAGPLAPVVILDRPQMGENIGAAARAMFNFGLSELRLVAPRDGWPNERAVAMASGADTVVTNATVHDDLETALAGLHRIYATTARHRDIALSAMTPRQAVADMLAASRQGKRCGLLFGREAAGLENEAVVRSHIAIHIPANPDFSSLNLAQAVLLIGYEWWLADWQPPAAATRQGYQAPADAKDMHYFMDRLERELAQAGFLAPPEKAPAMMRSIRAMFMRMDPSDQDLRTLHGIVSALIRPGEA